MKKIVFLVIACFWLSVPGLAVSGSSPGDWTGNLNLYLGAKALDKYEWEPTEEHKGVRSTLGFCEIVNVYGPALRLAFVRSVNIPGNTK